MEVQTDRTELLASCSPNAPIKHAPSGLLSPPMMADDKDSIYTFSDNCKSDNESESIGKCSLSNDTDSSGLNHHLSGSKQTTLDEMRAKKTIPTTLTDTPSSSPLQTASLTTAASPPSTSNEQISPRPNGSVVGNPSDTAPVSPKKVLSGKPRAFAEANKAAATAAASRASSGKSNRGRPKCKTLVTMYQSQLTDNKMGIKIRLKKSLEAPIRNAKSAASKRKSASTAPAAASTAPKTTNRKRTRKSKQKDTSDSDDSEYEKRRRVNNTSADKTKSRKSAAQNKDYTEPEEQSVWASQLPDEILLRIFENAVNLHGCLPTIVNIGQVCTQWRRVSLDPKLWHTLDLATWTKDRSELNLKKIIQNHLHGCKDLNLGESSVSILQIDGDDYWFYSFHFTANWKVTNIDCVMDYLLEACPDLVGISLAGWKKFTGDQLASLVENFTKLERIDLSSVNVSFLRRYRCEKSLISNSICPFFFIHQSELNPNRSAVGIQPLCSAIQKLGSRLTHLYLAHNRLAGIPQLVTALTVRIFDRGLPISFN